MNLTDLNHRFGIAGVVRFDEDRGFTRLRVTSKAATSTTVTTSVTTTSTPASATSPAAAVAPHLRKTRIDILLCVLENTNEIAGLFGI